MKRSMKGTVKVAACLSVLSLLFVCFWLGAYGYVCWSLISIIYFESLAAVLFKIAFIPYMILLFFLFEWNILSELLRYIHGQDGKKRQLLTTIML